jgi:predicted nucleotidyltransferase
VAAQSLHPALQKLPAEVRQTLRAYLKEIQSLLGDNLEAVVLYGSAARGDYLSDRSNVNLLLLLRSVDSALLARYAKLHRQWNRERIVVPLMLTRDELKLSAELFPLEYAEMKDHHVLLGGEDPFETLPIDLGRLLLQSQQEISGNLVRLRQRLVEGGGRPEAIAILLALSVTSLLPALRGLLRATGRSYRSTTDALLDQVESEFGMDLSPLREAWNVKCESRTPGPLELPRFFERYTNCLAALRDKADTMKASSRG